MFAKVDERGVERAPTLAEWQRLLSASGLAGPREKPPTQPGSTAPVVYGRVAGVQKGVRWVSPLPCTAAAGSLDIPQPGSSISFPVATVERGSLGTGQVQSAPLVVRYPDTAYRAHGNYGVDYSVSLSLKNSHASARSVTVALNSPLKTDVSKEGLEFFQTPPERIFFRGSVLLRYDDDRGKSVKRCVHLVERRGEMASPLVVLNMPSGSTRRITLEFLYPPDATPPQAITISTSQ